MGSSMWELLCLEHSVIEDGSHSQQDILFDNYQSFFAITPKEKLVPRCMFVDLEPTVIDEVRTGAYRRLFHPTKLITGPEDAANNFARGFFTVGKLIMSGVEHEIRRLFEACNSVQAIMLLRALGGGTGSGLTSAMFESMAEYPKTLKIELPIYPSATMTSASPVEPYNCLLGEHFCMEDIGLGIIMENEVLYDILGRGLSTSNPSYCSINRLIAQMVSSITCSIRFQNVQSSDVSVLQCNLVPYPRIHYPVCSVAPLFTPITHPQESFTILEMSRMLFSTRNQFVKLDSANGHYMSCVLSYRGNVAVSDVYDALCHIKRDQSIKFVDWCPTGFKVGVSMYSPVNIPGAGIDTTDTNVVMLANSSAMGQAWQRITHKFYILYSKRAFVHWFVGEGMEECEFTESLYNISSLVKDYEEITRPTSEDNTYEAPQAKVSMTLQNADKDNADESVDLPDQNVSYYVTMANGTAISATDRVSLQQKSSLIKSSLRKNGSIKEGEEDICTKQAQDRMKSLNEETESVSKKYQEVVADIQTLAEKELELRNRDPEVLTFSSTVENFIVGPDNTNQINENDDVMIIVKSSKSGSQDDKESTILSQQSRSQEEPEIAASKQVSNSQDTELVIVQHVSKGTIRSNDTDKDISRIKSNDEEKEKPLLSQISESRSDEKKVISELGTIGQSQDGIEKLFVSMSKSKSYEEDQIVEVQSEVSNGSEDEKKIAEYLIASSQPTSQEQKLVSKSTPSSKVIESSPKTMSKESSKNSQQNNDDETNKSNEKINSRVSTEETKEEKLMMQFESANERDQKIAIEESTISEKESIENEDNDEKTEKQEIEEQDIVKEEEEEEDDEQHTSEKADDEEDVDEEHVSEIADDEKERDEQHSSEKADDEEDELGEHEDEDEEDNEEVEITSSNVANEDGEDEEDEEDD